MEPRGSGNVDRIWSLVVVVGVNKLDKLLLLCIYKRQAGSKTDRGSR